MISHHSYTFSRELLLLMSLPTFIWIPHYYKLSWCIPNLPTFDGTFNILILDMCVCFEQAEDGPAMDPKFEKNATTPSLANPAILKLLPVRVSHLCLRSALLQRGNALAALGREDEARTSYEAVFPLLEGEPRCARVDWERHSVYVNIGNTFSRSGDFTLADAQYKIAEQLGNDHLSKEQGSEKDGKGMIACVKRARAFALRRAGRIDEAKQLLKEVVEQQIKDNLEADMKKAEELAAAAAKAKEAEPNPAE